MKRRLMSAGLVCLVVTLIASVFTGCGTAKVSNKKPYNIVWYDMGNLSKDHDLVYEEVSKYTLEKIGATVTCYPLPQYPEKMKMILAANEKFDMCFMSSGQNYEANAANGSFLPLEDLLENYGQDVLKTLPDYVLSAAKVNGVLYGLPAYKDWAEEMVLYYREDLAQKYQFDMSSITKFEDIEPMLEVIKKNEPNIYPLSTYPEHPYKFLPFDWVSGSRVGAVNLYNDDKTIVNQHTTPEAISLYKLMHRFFNKGYVRKDIAIVSSNTDIELDAFIRPASSLPYLVEQRNASTNKYKTKEIHIRNPVIGTANVRGVLTSVSATSQNPEKTMEFINLLNTDPYLRNLVAYGIKGTHYFANDDLYYRLPEGITDKSKGGYYSFVFTQGNKYITRMAEGTPADIYEKYKEFDEKAVKSPALGFAFNPDKVKSEYTAVTNVYNEYMPSIMSGTVNPDEYLPKAMEKFKAAGLDNLLAEMQNQYNEWQKNR